jgi:hypothetical protein
MREMAELFLREATARPNCPEALMAHCNFGTTRWYLGDFVGAHDHYQKVLELYDRRAMPISPTGSARSRALQRKTMMRLR